MRSLGPVPALNGVRGLAILLVIGRHYRNLIPAGGLGVDLFFVLSGFLITSLLLAEYGRTRRIELLQFYRRRALRLLPALLGLLVVYEVCVVWLGGFGNDAHGTRNVLWALSYAGNIPMAAGLDSESLSHLWSLAQEEQFYLLWPPVLLGLLALRARPRVVIACLVGLAAMVAAHRWAIADTAAMRRLWVAPDMHADALLVGCAAGYAFAYQLTGRWLRAVAPFCVAGCALVVAFEARENRSLYGWPLCLFVICAAIAILGVADQPKGPLARCLSLRPLQFLGLISYGLYLWHFPIFMAAGATPFALGLALAIAILSYRYVEKPFLRLKSKRRVTLARETRSVLGQLDEKAPA